MPKRKDYNSWDETFMAIAIIMSKRSKDPNSQVGACIINEQKRIVATGYNGFPNGISDDLFPWEREGNVLDVKYTYVCHSELNAILNSTVALANCKMYVTLFPCNECTKAIIQSGIKEIIYLDDKYKDTDTVIASKKMLDTAGIKYTQYNSSNKTLTINI